ncbi:MAG: flagellar biosynthetic protein FliO [Gammaproteobacteria bacterium]|nr:MAG: flagellar biosynthetic protein FliO [Gammaproteobacteria bacterium]
MKIITKNYYFQMLMLLLVLLPGQMLAAEHGLATDPVDISAFIKMFFGLIAVIALIFFLAWLSRKMKLLQHVSTGYEIKNLASLSLTNREKICLIEVGGKQILIGLAPGTISQLHVFDETIENSRTEATDASNHPFSQYFKNAIGISSTSSRFTQ